MYWRTSLFAAAVAVLATVIVLWNGYRERIHTADAAPGATAPDLAPTRASGTERAAPPQMVREPTNTGNSAPSETIDPNGSLVQRAQRESGLGTLADDELSSLLQMVANLERAAKQHRHDHLASGVSPDSVEVAEAAYGVEAALARANALLTHSYVLLPSGEKLPHYIAKDPNLHVVQGPGGVRGGKPFQTHILIDLKQNPIFARALEDLSRAHRAAEARRAAEAGENR